MIGRLPKTLKVNGTDYEIRSDFRTAMTIFQAYSDPELDMQAKAEVLIKCIYKQYQSIPVIDHYEAYTQAIWFLDGGEEHKEPTSNKKVIDWEQDEKMIFSAVNKVAGYETRSVDYLHWWTFLSLFSEIGECLLSSVIGIRNKKNKGKKLDKADQEFYKENKKLIDIKRKVSIEENNQLNEIRRKFGLKER